MSALRTTVLPISNVLAAVVMGFSGVMLAPLLLAFAGRDGGQPGFGAAALTIFVPAVAYWLLTRRFRRELKIRDGVLLVAIVWVLLPALAAIPLLTGIPGLRFTDAYFEAVSGLTTSGATVLTDLDHLAPSLNLWRHLLHWIGGMGIIVVAVALLPLLGVGGMQLYKAETPGPMKDSKLTPRIAHTAKALGYVYTGITVACIVCLRLAGMNWFDAVCHAFSAIALGGFSTHDASIGYYNSLPIEIVIGVFEVVAAINFATHFVALRERGLAAYRRDPEAMAVIKVLMLSCVGIALVLTWHGTYPDFWTALRYASFNVITMATDCGLTSQNFGQWPLFAPMWMLFLSCIVCSTGSTGGGIKMIRTLVLMKGSMRELTRILHPSIVMPVRVGNTVIEDRVVISVLAFVFLYFMSVVVLVLVLLASGLDLESSIGSIIACINNAGPGLGVTGPAANYAALTDFQTWVCAAAMLIGRLEVFTLLIVFTPAFWRK
jgi:trk system potassium uptake protein TrkH